jgi:GrpB-like predicted nucleotidyltransferase (UPF0157 family)
MKLLTPDQYQLIAEEAFSDVREALARALPFARVEHVGSSSIPGSISKGDIDVCVIVNLERPGDNREARENGLHSQARHASNP